MPADEAIVLAGGFGTRLRGSSTTCRSRSRRSPAARSLARLLDRLAGDGIRRCILATGYLAERIETVVGPRWQGMEIAYSVELAPLGTGGAIRLAARLLQGSGTHVLNGDTWLDVRARGAGSGARDRCTDGDGPGRWTTSPATAPPWTSTMAARSPSREGRARPGLDQRGLLLPGCRALDALPATQAFSFEHAVLQPRVAGAARWPAFTATAGFIDIGVPEDFARAQGLFADAP